MASARKSYARIKQDHARLPATEPFEFAALMADLLDGTIQATAVHEIRTPQGQLIRLEYDDPDGPPGAGRGGAGTRGRS